MKKAIIVIIIFSILAISFTATMINIKKNESDSVFKNTVSQVETNNVKVENNNSQEEINDNNVNETNELQNSIENYGIILGKSTYKGDYLHTDLIDGKELDTDNYINDVESLKIVLPKYILKAIYNEFEIGSYFWPIYEDYDSERYKTSLKEGWMTEAELGERKQEQREYINEYSTFNEQVENWQIELMQKFEKRDFKFSFDDRNLYIDFKDLCLYNPADKKFFQTGDYNGYLDKITELNVRVPLYDIYKYVTVFDTYSESQNTQENNDKYVLIDVDDGRDCLFESINDTYYRIYKTISRGDKSFIDYLEEEHDSYGMDSTDELKAYLNEVESTCNTLKNDDEVNIVYNRLFYSMSEGIVMISAYIKCDKNASFEEKQDVLKYVIKSEDVSWDVQIKDTLENNLQELQKIYKDINYKIDYKKFSNW